MSEQQEYTEINETLMRGFYNFLEVVPASRLNRGLRNLFMAYVQSEIDTGFEDFLGDFVHDLDVLFNFLDLIEDENNPPEK